MNPHEDVHGQLIVVALVVAFCILAAALAFMFWIERRSKRKPPRGIGGIKAPAANRKKRKR
jgi:Flp pilus assembly protein TadB